MKNRIIGILAHKHAGEYQPGYGQNEKYIEFARQFGDVILIDAQNENAIPVDLLLLPGGRDVNPLRYGKRPHTSTQPPDLEYEWFYENTFHKYVNLASKNELAIYGICAGFQNLNVFFGGKLNQQIWQAYSKDSDRGQLVDTLQFVKENQKFDIPNEWFDTNSKNKKRHLTNSIHHQGIYDHAYNDWYEHTISNQFNTLAINEDFGNVEVFIHKELPIAGEQAHPEERSDPSYTIDLINYLLDKIK